MKKAVLIGVLVLALVAAACGGGDTGSEATDDGDGHGAHDMSGGQMGGRVLGEAADESDATREILVETLDELAFDPEMIDVEEGEVVTFVVENVGKTRHEFVLGDETYQEMHEQDMSDGGHSDGVSNALSLEPGGSGKITWRFTESGEVSYGCHEPGHYDGGMVGTIAVS